jgi:hypothetical protein
MTAQIPERIILAGRPRALYGDPLHRLLASSRMTVREYGTGFSTGCYRGYCGTWEIIDHRLHLVHLNLMCPDEAPIPKELRTRLLRAASCANFPIPAHWFNGRLRIAIGRRLVYSHHGWSHWFERERVIAFAAGKVRREREVDTRAMLERWLRRNPQVRDHLDGTAGQGEPGPLIWFDDSEEDWEADWWPHDYARKLRQ